jgi:signal transduction histidine kinase
VTTLLTLSDHWRSATTRLIMIYGAFFAVWGIVLVAAVYWETNGYLSRVVDAIVEQRASYLGAIDRANLAEAMEATGALDLRGVMSLGVFTHDGGYVTGNIERMPADLPVDGEIHGLPYGLERRGRSERTPARGLAMRLASGETLIVARDTSVIDQVGVIIRHALLWGVSLTVIPGLIGGFLLSRGPLKRVRAIEAAIEPISRGDLRLRLPVSKRGDEVDLLAAIVNRMLDEIERLIGEVKGVCDNIAHDLRTPLTRLRTQLHRLQQTGGGEDGVEPMLERCIVDVDSLLERFRALLRISELEDLRRRSGFGEVDLAEILQQVHELYVPLAEDGGIAFRIDSAPRATIHGDRHLLFEAFSNLVANAIKFTPRGGAVRVATTRHAAGPSVEIIDSGPGIPEGERDAVLQRFYRSDSGRELAAQGYGLGLSIVSAIVRLHGFRLRIADNDGGGARVGVECWVEAIPAA